MYVRTMKQITGQVQQIDEYTPDRGITTLAPIAEGADRELWGRILGMNDYEVLTEDVPPECAPMNGVVAIHTKSVEGKVWYLLAELP
jgi:hypothetical protein